MKDVAQKIVIGIVVAIFSAGLTWVISRASKPNVQILVDSPLVLPTERLTVFHIHNFGGAPADNIEIRFIKAIAVSAVFSITSPPAQQDSIGRAILIVPKLRPFDDVSFYIKETVDSGKTPRELVPDSVYDEGKIGFSTLDDRLTTV